MEEQITTKQKFQNNIQVHGIHDLSKIKDFFFKFWKVTQTWGTGIYMIGREKA